MCVCVYFHIFMSGITCHVCNRTYKNSHTCLGGQCKLCLITSKNLRTHRCTVTKIMNLDVEQQVNDIKTYTCDACRIDCISSKRIRVWKHCQLCLDCYRVPQIQNEIWHMRYMLNHYYSVKGMVWCEMCHTSIIDRTSACVIRSFEADHKEPNDKFMSVGTMIRQGYTFTEILKELEKCRLLCFQCHDVVTWTQQKTGILHLKHYEQLSTSVQQQLTHVINNMESTLLKRVLSD